MLNKTIRADYESYIKKLHFDIIENEEDKNFYLQLYSQFHNVVVKAPLTCYTFQHFSISDEQMISLVKKHGCNIAEQHPYKNIIEYTIYSEDRNKLEQLINEINSIQIMARLEDKHE